MNSQPNTRTMTMKTFGMMLIGLWALVMPAFGQPSFDDLPEVTVSAKASGDTFVSGQRGFVVVVLDHGHELHSWPSIDQDVLPPEIAEFAIRTKVRIENLPEFITVGPVQWPDPKPALVPDVTGSGEGSVEALTYKDRAVLYLPFLVAMDAPIGEVGLKVVVELQACDENTCYIPQFDVNIVDVSITTEAGGQLVDPDFEGFDASVFDRADFGPSAATKVETDKTADAEAVYAGAKFLGLVSLPAPGSSGFLLAIAFAGMIGGFVLNLTPCVLPVIPIKILTLNKHAGENRKRAAYLGVWMAVGVVAFWTLLSIPVLSIKWLADPSVIFGIWWITGGIGLVLFFAAAGSMGLFHFKLPQNAYKFNPSAENAFGSLMFGMMTAVLGLPCFGFIVGGLLPAATTTGSFVVVTMFFSIGVGMALPYLVLSAFPRLLKHVPKTGPASDLVKQVMGLLLMAAGAYFIGSGVLVLVAEMPHLAKVLHWWAAGLFVVATGVWLVYRTVRITKKVLPRVVFTVVSLLLAAAGIMLAQNQTAQAYERWEQKEAAHQKQLVAGGYSTGAWNEYSQEMFDKARSDGKVVVLDFTAEWCLNCKALKAAVLNVEPVKGRLLEEDVVAFEVDLTARSAPGWAKLRELGQTGIPTLAVFGPGLPGGPWIANVYSSGQVVSALENAVGTGSAENSAR
jgi:thiol:disulfide interchange protein